MRCEYCKFAPPVGPEGEQDECGYYEKYGTIWKNGDYGCTLRRQTLEKNEREYDEYLGWMGTEMGLEMQFEYLKLDLKNTIERCKHFVGLDCYKPKIYHRHGKAFCRAYRNRWYSNKEEPDFDAMCSEAFGLMVKKVGEGGIWYHLTNRGLEWLGRQVKVKIKLDV